MSILVQKFGGTSVGDTRRISLVADRIKRNYLDGHKVVVILSAMGHTTDHLVQMANEVHTNPHGREMDMLLSTGEQVSIALMSLALEQKGVPATSLTGLQAGIQIVGEHTEARIASINASGIQKHLDQNKVCLIAGFQGINIENEIFTLGRGGSDTTAVAVAVALHADVCEIYTDVDGVYTTDPNKVSSARRIQQISYEEMLEMARLGAGVLHSRCIELASKYNIILHVRSSFNNNEGSYVLSEDKILEKELVRGVSLKSDESRITIFDLEDKPGLAAKLFGLMAEKDINVNLIVQNRGKGDKNTISFTVLRKQLSKAQAIALEFIQQEKSGKVESTDEIAIVSAVGVGMQSHSGVAASMFKALAEINANIEMISTSEIKVSVVLRPSEGLKALEAVHNVFGLGKEKH